MDGGGGLHCSAADDHRCPEELPDLVALSEEEEGSDHAQRDTKLAEEAKGGPRDLAARKLWPGWGRGWVVECALGEATVWRITMIVSKIAIVKNLVFGKLWVEAAASPPFSVAHGVA